MGNGGLSIFQRGHLYQNHVKIDFVCSFGALYELSQKHHISSQLTWDEKMTGPVFFKIWFHNLDSVLPLFHRKSYSILQCLMEFLLQGVWKLPLVKLSAQQVFRILECFSMSSISFDFLAHWLWQFWFCFWWFCDKWIADLLQNVHKSSC